MLQIDRAVHQCFSFGTLMEQIKILSNQTFYYLTMFNRRSSVNTVNRNLNNCNQQKSPYKSTRRVEKKSSQNEPLMKTNSIKLPSVVKPQQNQYILGEVIGEGAFAEVRLAQRQSDGQKFVIKIYQKHRLCTEQKRQAIKKQVEILKNISHAYLIKIVDNYETKQTINIVMENFSNQCLASYAKTNYPLSEEVLKKITKSIATALVYLHSNKISHRDLKPENVLIDSKGEIKIIDLGLAMMGDCSEMTVAGTPQYMCPELLNKKHYCPYKADIWAFGIMLYKITMGYFPQDNCLISSKKSIKRDSKNIANFELRFPAEVNPGLEYLIEKMLEKDPSQRITAEQILEDSWIKPRNFKLEISKLLKPATS